jgi:putative ABC transport system permease protein
MNLYSLSIAYIRARWLTSSLLVLLLAMGVATISLLLHFSHQAEQRLAHDGRGFDLVVGAKGSPLQLILSSIYHMDIPTGNIPLAEAQRLQKHPQVKQAIPLALGDSYRGFRIVGTKQDYIAHYKAELAEGQFFVAPLEAVLGATVAREAKVKVGATFAGSHGLTDGGEEHADSPYKVVGVLKPTGTVIDRLVLTPVESVWKIHGSEAHHQHEEEAHEEHKHHNHAKGNHEEQIKASDEITALLITYRSRAAAMPLPREINRMSRVQAASPAFETARLLSLLGIGLDTLRLFGIILIVSALAGMLVAVYQSMLERRVDIALMRVLGASRGMLMKQVVLEAGLLIAAGIGAGLVLSHVALAMLPSLSAQLANMGFTPLQLLPGEIGMAAGLLIAGLCVALLPALAAYRVDVSRTLAKA